MILSYDPATHRRCLCCSYRRQPPLVAVIGAVFPSGAVLLECGHIGSSLDEFRELHPEWVE